MSGILPAVLTFTLGAEPDPSPDVTPEASRVSEGFPASAGDPDFGSDISLYPDLDETWTPIDGRRMLAEQILRRITTERGTLDFWPNDGIDIRDFLRDVITADTLFQNKQLLQNEIEKDERVFEAPVSMTYDQRHGDKLMISIGITTADDTFALVLSVSSLTVDALINSQPVS
jgi:hypothetical protein